MNCVSPNAPYYSRRRLVYPTPNQRINDLKLYLARPENCGKLFSLSATLDGMEYDYHRKQLRFLLRSVIAVHHNDTYSRPLIHDFLVNIWEPRDHRKAKAGIARSFKDGYQRVLWFEGCLFDAQTIGHIRNVTVSRYHYKEPFFHVDWMQTRRNARTGCRYLNGIRGRMLIEQHMDKPYPDSYRTAEATGNWSGAPKYKNKGDPDADALV